MRRYATTPIFISANPEWDAERYEQALEANEARYPKCCVCGCRIHADEVFVDEDGYLCDDCAHDRYYVSMDEIIREDEE